MDTLPRSISSPCSTSLLHLKQQQVISVQRLRSTNVNNAPIQPAQIPNAASMKLSLTGIVIYIL